MLTSITPETLVSLQNYVRVGEVVEVVDRNEIRVRLSIEDRTAEIVTQFAMGNSVIPKVGDNVVVAGERFDSGFIIGHMPRDPVTMRQFSVEQDVESGKTTLSVPKGDLDIQAEDGNICLKASKNIQMESEAFSLFSAKGNINIADAKYKGLRMTANIAQTRLLLGKIHTTVERLIEKAKDVYRQVEGLNRTKAGRMRTLVDGSYHLKSERIIEKAKKEVRIDGDKINLG